MVVPVVNRNPLLIRLCYVAFMSRVLVLVTYINSLLLQG